MGIGYRIKEARERLGLTQTELGEIVGVTGSAITNYEKETSHPKEQVIYKLIETLNVDANYLFQDCVKLPKDKNDITLSEYEHIKKYRALDDFGKKRINRDLDEETKRVEEIRNQQQLLSDQQEHINQLKQRIVTELVSRIVLPLYARFASGGSGEYLFDDIPTDVIEVEDTPAARKADFVIGVNGHSMEPDYYDGDKVFVKKTSDLNTGDIGIFLKGENCYIKELGTDRLISHNPDKETYPDIQADEEIMIVGKVIGKVEDD